jgi:hypothetical protein
MDAGYFRNYCGRGSYDEHYREHSGIEHCLRTARRLGIRARSVVVLGAATGRVLEDFEAAWRVQPSGCEISAWAHARIPARLRRRIALADMRDYVPALAARGARFDVLFTNSLVYLDVAELPQLAALCSRIASHLHFYSSTSEAYEPGDAYRVTLRPRTWWRELFLRAGFEPTRSPYFWRSARPRRPPARRRAARA